MSGFEIVGLLLATPGAIRDLIAFGRATATAVNRVRHPESLPADLRAFNLESENRKLNTYIDISSRIVRSTRYDEDIRAALNSDFMAFQQALKDANDLVHKLLDHNVVMQALLESRCMKKLADQVTLMGSSKRQFMDMIDTLHVKDQMQSFAKLDTKHFSVDPTPVLDITECIKVFRGHLTVAIRDLQPQQGNFLLELRPYTDESKEEEEARAQDVAETLSTAHGNDHILDCIGYVDVTGLRSLGIVFAFPPKVESYETLDRYIGLVGRPIPPLDVRVKLCQALAAAVLQVHTLQAPMVHKNINPENLLLLFADTATPETLPNNPSVCLINWQLSRVASESTNWSRFSQWWQKIYQHPSRQIPRRESVYTLDHDIYSLGVCMIEILLWQPLVVRDATGKPVSKVQGLLLDNAQVAQNLPGDVATWTGPQPQDVVDRLKGLAMMNVPPAAGRGLSALILRCLDGLKEPKDALGPVFTSVIKEPLERITI